MRSKGSRLLSSRRPATRVISSSSRKPSMARRTRSISASREDRHGALKTDELPRALVELEVLVAAAHVGRVDLELQPDRQVVVLLQRPVAEHQASVAARLGV